MEEADKPIGEVNDVKSEASKTEVKNVNKKPNKIMIFNKKEKNNV